MKTKIKLSFVINTYEKRDHLNWTLKSIYEQIKDREDTELIVVLDKTGIDMSDIASKYGAKYYVTNYRSGDIGGPQNVGIKVAQGEYICLTDQDYLFRHDATDIIINHIKQKPFARLLMIWDRGAYQNPTPQNEEEFFQIYNQKSGQPNSYGYIQEHPWGPVNIQRRDILLAVGGHDERYRGCTDTERDLGFRIHESGIRSFFIETIAMHQGHEPRDYKKEYEEIPEFRDWVTSPDHVDILASNLNKYNATGIVVANEGVDWGVAGNI